MGLFKKQPDPISDRARTLNSEISALEAQIKKLQAEASEKPRLRPATLPHGATPVPARVPEKATLPEPIFEQVDQNPLTGQAEGLTPQHFNDQGVRKYDFVALVERIKRHFQGPQLSNPKLVNYLAAGSIQGLRSLRYEKRVARNRFILWTIVLGALLLGILGVVMRR